MKTMNMLRLCNVVFFDLFKIKHSLHNNNDHITKAIDWLCLAQDSTPDFGVSEGYHLFHGWLPSYPETTGYVIETFYDCSEYFNNEKYKKRAIQMADWLLSVQNDDGSIQDSNFTRKMTFDTGQVIFGFVRTFEETGDERYKEAAIKAGKWLLNDQEDDGTWKKHASGNIPHTYYTRVAWSLLRLHRITDDMKYIDSSKRNIDWALKQQKENGWFNSSSFSLKAHANPYTHTIAYTLRGILEAGLYLNEKKYIDSIDHAVTKLFEKQEKTGKIAGTYNRDWIGDNHFSCLTGNAQLAIILNKLYEKTRKDQFRNAAKKINQYLKYRQELRIKNRCVHGAIAGSFPIWGKYIHYAYPNWASKFFIDSLIIEEEIEKAGA